MAHDLFVRVVGLVFVLLVDPVRETIDGIDRGVSIRNKVWEVGNITTLIEEWCIDEVPIGLIRATLVLNIISEGDTFNKWMFTLELCP